MVMGRDSRSKGHGFKSRHCILNGHFFTYICSKNCNVCLKRPKNNEKEAVVGPFKKPFEQQQVVSMCCQWSSGGTHIPDSLLALVSFQL